MHISGKFVIPPKANDESIKANIEMQKVNDKSIKANIRKQIGKIIPGLSDKTEDHILRIYEARNSRSVWKKRYNAFDRIKSNQSIRSNKVIDKRRDH